MRTRWIGLVSVVALAACGGGALTVQSGDASSADIRATVPASTSTTRASTTVAAPPTTEATSTTEETTVPATTAPDTTEAPTSTSSTVPPSTVDPSAGDGPVFELDPQKPPQQYDSFLQGAINDIERFWRITYPEVYRGSYDELSGGVYPVYPGRTDVPGGCGMQRTTYRDVQGNAFYCGEGDFIAYDDNDLFPTIADQIGEFALAVAIAHEWGHAIQQRAQFSGQTLLLEQQADCFAGAWVRFIADGNGKYVDFNTDDLNVAMNGLILVRDEPGIISRTDAHGSAFDRVGAFQEGWFGGAARCRDFATDAPPTTLLPFTDTDYQTGGNAPYSEIIGLLQKGLDDVWTVELQQEGTSFTPPTMDIGDDDTGARCSDVPADALKIAFYCPSSNTIVASDTRLRELYRKFGDNAVGILLSDAYSDAVQRALGSTLGGEPRALMDDCLSGTWTRALFPDPNVQQEVTISAGDLDEGIQTLIAIGDPSPDTNQQGSPFEKIEAFREGVLNGLDACKARLTN